MNTYKGWTNEETWCYSLDVFTDVLSNKYWTHRAMVLTKEELAEEMREYALSETEDSSCALIKDLITHSVEQINFSELAEELLKRILFN